MVFLFFAFHTEAKPFIDYFKLKKLYEPSKFQIFYGDEILLTITTEGILQAAIATAFVFTKFGINDDTIALNIGICGAKEYRFSKGDVILCNKIINHYSKKRFYPDILITHHMKEATLESFFHPVKKDIFSGEIEGDIVDMEGAGFFESASSFLPPHSIQCIKVVYDFLEEHCKTDRREIETLMQQSIPLVESLINSLIHLNSGLSNRFFEQENLKQITEKLKNSLHLTTFMTFQLEELLKSYLIRHNELPENLSEFLYANVSSKKEGKKYFERLKRLLTI